MANMTFKANILPSTNLGYNLGSSTQQWAVYGILNGTATYASNASYATNAASANYAINAASATYANSSNCASHAIHSGSATYSTSAAQATHSASANYSTSAAQATHSASAVYASNATGATYIYTGGPSNTSESTQDARIKAAIKSYFDNNKASIPRNKTISLYVSTGNGEQATGYFLSGYDSTPYGGFFVSHYDTPRYVGISNGSYSCYELLRNNGGTYSINITGSAGSVAWGNVTGKPGSFTPSSHTHSYRADTAPTGGAYWRGTPLIGGDGVMEIGRIIDFHDPGTSTADYNCRLHCNGGPMYCTSAFYGAVWNDYAEMRNVPEANERLDKNEGRTVKLAGRCVHEVGDDTMVLSTDRMQPGCKIISDTFGFNIGETDDCKTPIAVSGRALVYIYEGRETARKYIGQPVCSGPDGTVSIMTDEEYAAKGYCCVGIISAVPEYKTWGSGNIQVNGRIWIYVK